MTYNVKQCLLAVVAKQRHILPNDVIFQKQKCLNKRRRIDDCVREVSLK